jgi:glyoxylase-like metal-dependent hydrolase (beta-lactamase superfamily II)/8-oxo-dGTP pyrophosphatase MutT (NUDIX family)
LTDHVPDRAAGAEPVAVDCVPVTAPAKPVFKESAVVVLVRGHGESLETFWVLRSDTVGYMPGFRGFIGGKVNPEDLDLPVEGAEDEADRVMRACAIREAFEEAGVLVGLERAADPASLAEPRRRLLEGEADFTALAREHGWRFRAHDLTFCGRWQTPPFTHVRFDARYYAARVPEGQAAVVHPGELASGEWIRPRAALERWMRGEDTFAAPILYTLIALTEGEEGLAERLREAPESLGQPARRIELKWGILLHPMKTRPLPPATHTNAYLVGEREMAVIDPGSNDPGELEKLFRLIDMVGRDGRKPRLVLLTHEHPDHVAGARAVSERYRIPVAGHAETGKHVRLDFAIADGEVVKLLGGDADWALRAVHTPGHARGHLCFLHERTRSLFSGDHIPGGRGTVIIDPPEGDMGDYVGSLERLLTLDVETLFPAHGSPQGGAKRRIHGLIEHRRTREAKVADALARAGDASLETLLERAYADTPRDLWPYAERSLLAHLLELERQGRARHEGERWRVVTGPPA